MELLQKILSEHQLKLKSYTKLTGGDTNQVYRVRCEVKEIVLKLQTKAIASDLFLAEAKGLALIKASKSFTTPEVLAHGILDDTPYLILEYVAGGETPAKFWEQFAVSLTALHKTTQITYGLDHDNYIGALRQYNSPERTANNFYLNQRLIPQFRLAASNGFTFNNLDLFYKKTLQLIPDEAPALIHGDLWSGNYLASEKSHPVLIDPAACFASREMDLAMMHLFGGFPSSVFNLYQEAFPPPDGWEERVPLYQLYYLLVHLNMFGSSYLSRVNNILEHYT